MASLPSDASQPDLHFTLSWVSHYGTDGFDKNPAAYFFISLLLNGTLYAWNTLDGNTHGPPEPCMEEVNTVSDNS